MISTFADSLEPVSLEEITSRAALMSRVDRKYLLHRDQACEIIGGMADQFQVMEIGGQRLFRYHTNYYDTKELTSFYDAAHQRRKKFKVRTREYCDSEQAFFEVKTASGSSLTLKDRIEISPEQTDRATPKTAQREFAQEMVSQRLGLSPDLSSLTHTLSSQYWRLTLLMPETDERVTVDLGLTVSTPEGTTVCVPEQVIVETKSRTGRSELDRELWKQKVRPLRLSKYATGMALLNSDLPRNRWVNTIKHLEVENQMFAQHG